MSGFSRGLMFASTLAASVAALPAQAGDLQSSCHIGNDQLTIDMQDGHFAGQEIVINLNPNEDRPVLVGETLYTLLATTTGGSIIEAAGDINQNAVQLNNERGKDGLSHKFFISQQQPSWQMMAVGIPQSGEARITLEVSGEGSFQHGEVECSTDNSGFRLEI